MLSFFILALNSYTRINFVILHIFSKDIIAVRIWIIYQV